MTITGGNINDRFLVMDTAQGIIPFVISNTMKYTGEISIKKIIAMGRKLTLPEDFKDHDFFKIMRKVKTWKK